MIALLKIYITLFILYVLLWGAIEVLWEEDRVCDEVRELVHDTGIKFATVTLIGALVVFASMLIMLIWRA